MTAYVLGARHRVLDNVDIPLSSFIAKVCMLLKNSAFRSDNTNPIEGNSDTDFVMGFFFFLEIIFFLISECKLFLLLSLKKWSNIALISLAISAVDFFKN